MTTLIWDTRNNRVYRMGIYHDPLPPNPPGRVGFGRGGRPPKPPRDFQPQPKRTRRGPLPREDSHVQRILRTIREAGPSGITSRQLVEIYGISRGHASASLNNLKKGRYIKAVGQFRNSSTGRINYRWALA
jgi:hypothetical protein